MRYKLTFAIGFGAGYVLGARAGTERYQQIENAWRRFVDTPAVQEAAGVVGAQASQAFDQAKHTVTTKVSDTVSSKLHHGSSDGGARATSSTTATPRSESGGTSTVTAGDDAAYPGTA